MVIFRSLSLCDFGFALGLWLFCTFPIFAQKDTTFYLREIGVKASPLAPYASGSKLQSIDSVFINLQNTLSLGELLSLQSPIYCKQYGNGMSSNISMRGTGAGHTAVFWNGLNINSMTLGESDLSLLPTFALEQVEVQYGSASSLYGTDAIGGSVHLLSQKAYFQKRQQIGFQQDIGSFGFSFSGIKFNWANSKIETKTKLYYSEARNDFEFQNISQINKTIQTQTNAQFAYKGFTHETNYRLSTHQTLGLKLWYHQTDRQVQAPMIDLQSQDFQTDRNLRLSLDYEHISTKGNLKIRYAFLSDYTKFSQYPAIPTLRNIGFVQYEREIGQKIFLNIGANWDNINANNEYYGGKISENRQDIFASLKYFALRNWTITVNARQNFVSQYRPAFAPSVGSEYVMKFGNSHELIIKSLFSKSYKIPTLNNRFWQPGGNPDLLAENALSGELGFLYLFKKAGTEWKTELTAYQMNVENWIIWLPTGSFWSPQNLAEVRVRGLEFTQNFTQKTAWGNYHIGGNYGFTQSQNQKALGEYDRSAGKQLPYIPFHRLTLFGQANWRKYYGLINWQLTSYRFTTTDNERFLEGFHLLNAQVGRNLPYKKMQFSISLKINNLLNQSYQNIEHRAMPLQNFQITFKTNFL